MFKFVVRRLLIAIPVLLGVTCVAYFIMTLAPGDAVDMACISRAVAPSIFPLNSVPELYLRVTS